MINKAELPDVQNQIGDYKFPLNAGVTHMKAPILIKTNEDLQSTVADVSMLVSLDRSLKGINMSRLPQLLSRNRDKWVVDTMKPVLIEMLGVMESEEGLIIYKFPYFYAKSAPVSQNVGLSHVDVTLKGRMDHRGDYKMTLSIEVPVMTLCPCSKEISENNAHNQRAIVMVEVDLGEEIIWIEELVGMVESSASSPLYPILKREDEKYVTEAAYANPRFVEDLVREVASKLQADPRAIWYHIQVSSEESIHQHNAVAEIYKGGIARNVVGVRDEILQFAESMEYKLRKNDHKGGWIENQYSLEWLLDKLNEEVQELNEAIKNETVEDAVLETADVANFSLMIHDILRRFGK